MDAERDNKGKSVIDYNAVSGESSSRLGFQDSFELGLALPIPDSFDGELGRDTAAGTITGSSRAKHSRRRFETDGGVGSSTDYKRVRHSIDDVNDNIIILSDSDSDSDSEPFVNFDSVADLDSLEDDLVREDPECAWFLREVPRPAVVEEPVELNLFPLQPMAPSERRQVSVDREKREVPLVRATARVVEEERRIQEETRRRNRERYVRYHQQKVRDQRQTARMVAKRFSQRITDDGSPQEEKKESSAVVNEESDDDPDSPFSLAMEGINNGDSKKRGYKKSMDNFPNSILQPDMGSEKKGKEHCGLAGCVKCTAPKLLHLSLKVLAKNADAIVSLDLVPDELRDKLSQMVSDSRKLNAHFFELLVRGSPSEIRVKDLSLLTVEDFTKIFTTCDTGNLTVLQLDLCGQCLTDYALHATLHRSSTSLNALATISLKGAHRLTDEGLNALTFAPALQSINLSQCSLLSSKGINKITSNFQSALKELYIDDCQNIDPIHILPGLKKLLHLEVLSVAGIQTISDEFVIGISKSCAENMKELNFANCVELTDVSLKSLGKSCPTLCALDLSFLRKLTDSTLKHLANGCRSIRRLQLCRNGFSDEAIAAFLEASQKSIEVLSLNNISKVTCNTASSILKCSKLLSLDLSWCRKLTDEEIRLIIEQCLDLEQLKLFGCTQLTGVFLNHLHSKVKIIGSQTGLVLEHFSEHIESPLRYSSSKIAFTKP